MGKAKESQTRIGTGIGGKVPKGKPHQNLARRAKAKAKEHPSEW